MFCLMNEADLVSRMFIESAAQSRGSGRPTPRTVFRGTIFSMSSVIWMLARLIMLHKSEKNSAITQVDIHIDSRVG